MATVILFVGHILAAIMDQWIFFRLIAVTISGVIIGFGPVSLILSMPPRLIERRSVLRVAWVASIPLSLGLGWAYSGMQIDLNVMMTLCSITMVYHAWCDLRLTSMIQRLDLVSIHNNSSGHRLG